MIIKYYFNTSSKNKKTLGHKYIQSLEPSVLKPTYQAFAILNQSKSTVR